MKVLIVRQPTGTVNDHSLDGYRVGLVYDLKSGLAEYLVAQGYALIEMRREPTVAITNRDRRSVPRDGTHGGRRSHE